MTTEEMQYKIADQSDTIIKLKEIIEADTVMLASQQDTIEGLQLGVIILTGLFFVFSGIIFTFLT